MDDAAAVERRLTSSRHRGRRASITFGMLATMAAAGIADERHRIADEDGRRRRRGECHRRGTRRSRDRECRNDDDATSMGAMSEGEQRERDEEREGLGFILCGSVIYRAWTFFYEKTLL